jgi:hypothetical protein
MNCTVTTVTNTANTNAPGLLAATVRAKIAAETLTLSMQTFVGSTAAAVLTVNELRAAIDKLEMKYGLPPSREAIHRPDPKLV